MRDQGIRDSRDQVADRGMAVLARGLVREYRRGAERIRALKGVDVAIAAGEFVGLTGHSGAGKTTFLNLAGLMDRPTEGSLSVLGNDVTPRGLGHDPKSATDLGHVPRRPRVKLDALRRRNIGFVFQEFYLMPTLTALENVLLPTMWGRGRDEGGRMKDERAGGSRERAMELLSLVGLKHRITHRPTELSGGEMQRVAIARALINDPRLLLADEPTGNLDTKTRDEVLNLLTSLNRDSGLTVLVATHDWSLESRFSRVIRLEDGNVV